MNDTSTGNRPEAVRYRGQSGCSAATCSKCIAKTRRGASLADSLRNELLAIERERPDDLPISMGLRYLDEQYPHRRLQLEAAAPLDQPLPICALLWSLLIRSGSGVAGSV